MGMEHDPNIPGRQPNLRASDADRAQIIELLRRHHQDGRLTAEELAERIERVNAATTFGDLDAAMANLPRLLPPLAPLTETVQERTPGAVRQTFYRVLFAYVVINLFLLWYLGVQWPWSILADLGAAWVGTGHGVLRILGLRSPRRPEPVSHPVGLLREWYIQQV
jgi:Domain of unknown function (DUF1707)